MLSDNINHCGSMGDNGAGAESTTPFSTKFTILKFNSDKKSLTKTSAAKLGSKKKAKLNIFKKCQEQN